MYVAWRTKTMKWEWEKNVAVSIDSVKNTSARISIYIFILCSTHLIKHTQREQTSAKCVRCKLHSTHSTACRLWNGKSQGKTAEWKIYINAIARDQTEIWLLWSLSTGKCTDLKNVSLSHFISLLFFVRRWLTPFYNCCSMYVYIQMFIYRCSTHDCGLHAPNENVTQENVKHIYE